MSWSRRLPRRGLLFIVAAALTVPASTLAPRAAAAQEEFTNLQVFPEDISRPELMGAMRGFAMALGVRCTHCHVDGEGVPFAERDWASDEKPAKEKARAMLRMVQAINGEYLAQLPDRRGPNVAVTCATCHGGVRRPEAIDRVVERLIDEEGIDFAEERYRALREEYYGSRAYDFGEQPLVELATRLARGERGAEAERALLLNLEFHPESAQSMAGLGQLAEAAGDTDRAIEWYRKALEIQPENRQVQRRLRQLTGGGV